MRIVQLINRRQRRGAEVFAAQLADGLVERGHEVTVVGLYAPPPDPLRTRSAATSDLNASGGGKLNFRRVEDLCRQLEALRPDVVQANGSDTLKYSVFARLKLRARWPLVYRNISVTSHWLRYPGHRLWVSWLLRRADFVAAVSEAARADLETVFAVDTARLRTIPIGTEVPANPDRPGTRALLANELGLKDSARILMHIGNFSGEKNHAWMIGAFRDVRLRCPEAHLVLVGDGPLREEISALGRSPDLAGHVHLLGSRPGAGRLTAGADVLLLPSLIEGVPGVVLEAAAHGTPAVATNVGGLGEAVVDGRTGLLVRLGDRPAFVESIMRLLDDDAERARFGAAARDWISHNYDIDAIIEAFDSVYRELAAPGALRPSPPVPPKPGARRVGRSGSPAG